MTQKRPRLERILRVRWRLLLRRLERISPMLLAWIPSWGTSLLLHGLAILILALYLYVHSGGQRAGTFQGALSNQQLTEDLTSLFDSDHAGDRSPSSRSARSSLERRFGPLRIDGPHAEQRASSCLDAPEECCLTVFYYRTERNDFALQVLRDGK